MRQVQSDFQPIIDTILAQYVGTKPTVMHVMALREQIARVAAHKSRDQRVIGKKTGRRGTKTNLPG
jgi:hypothetical protein